MSRGVLIKIKTPNFQKYKDDCLHPCIRYVEEGFLGYKWWMVQSPYYGNNEKIENPILYFSKDVEYPTNWEAIGVVSETPSKGYNSDPNLFYEDGKLWVFWRECNTLTCDNLNVSKATVGVSTTDGIIFSESQVYLTESQTNVDHELCPILIKKKETYYFYAAYYQLKPIRKNLGISVWEGNSLDRPDFKISEIIKVPTIYTCDKYKQLQVGSQLLFLPKFLKHDIWHFDIVMHKDQLYILSVAEWGDNIMLSTVSNSINLPIETMITPLVNKHRSNIKSLYKPTGFILNDKLYVYYTVKSNVDKNMNEMYVSFCDFSKVSAQR